MNGEISSTTYQEYLLKSKFGWTQSELEAEPFENIQYYLKIMTWEYQRDSSRMNQNL